MKTFKLVIDELSKRGETISFMESCTGGALASEVTSTEGASEVLKFSAVTYSNEYKIKMGVSEKVIDKYSVYSMNTAHEMAVAISKFANSNIGVGVTGKLNRADINNNYGKDNEVFISIFYKGNHYDIDVIVDKTSRKANKEVIVDLVIDKLEEILNIKK